MSFDYADKVNFNRIGSGLFEIAKAIDKLADVLTPIEITKEDKKEDSNNGD